MLGPLPQFTKNPTSFKNSSLQFGDELDNLLNTDVQPDHDDTGKISYNYNALGWWTFRNPY